MLFGSLHNRRKKPRARFAAGLVAALSLVAQLGSVAHLAVVQHVTCLEHGETIDVARQSGTPALADAKPVREDRIAATSEPGHGHDHCPLAAFRRQRALSQSEARILPPATADPRPFVLAAHVTPAPAIALLSLAPKSSPPLAS